VSMLRHLLRVIVVGSLNHSALHVRLSCDFTQWPLFKSRKQMEMYLQYRAEETADECR